MAQLLDELCGAVVQAMEVVAPSLRHTPPCVTVDTSQSSVQVPESKTSNRVHLDISLDYSRTIYIKSLAFGQRTWTEVTREREVVCV
jgi:hypothetical protein